MLVNFICSLPPTRPRKEGRVSISKNLNSIINDFNNYQKMFKRRSIARLYLKAFNYKIRPILLTLLSSSLALVPFIWEGQKEAFWFAFAVGSIGGLLFSIIAILIYLPLFLPICNKGNSKKPHINNL